MLLIILLSEYTWIYIFSNTKNLKIEIGNENLTQNTNIITRCIDFVRKIQYNKTEQK